MTPRQLSDVILHLLNKQHSRRPKSPACKGECSCISGTQEFLEGSNQVLQPQFGCVLHSCRAANGYNEEYVYQPVSRCRRHSHVSTVARLANLIIGITIESPCYCCLILIDRQPGDVKFITILVVWVHFHGICQNNYANKAFARRGQLVTITIIIIVVCWFIFNSNHMTPNKW